MTRNLLLIMMFGQGMVAYAQAGKQEVVCAASGEMRNSNNTNINWVIGEVVTLDMKNSKYQLTSGITQANYIVTMVVNNLKNLDITLFPNPVINSLQIQDKSNSLLNTNYVIYDMAGKNLQEGNIDGVLTVINFSKLTVSNYLLSITDASGNVLQSYKIIKQ